MATLSEIRARADLALLPPFLTVATFVVLAADEGGFQPSTFYPVTLLLLALLVVCAIALPLPRPSLATALAVGLLAGYAAWSWLSVAWADSQGIAVEGANRAVLYAIVFALLALWPVRGRQGAFLIGFFALSIAVIGLVEILKVNASSEPVEYFFRGRLTEPVGYANANTALWTLALIPCIVLTARREVHPLLRGLFFGSAGILTGLALLGQSRGWFLALPLVAVIAVAIIPGRSRVLVVLAGLAAGIAVMARPVLDVFEAQGADPIDPLFADATRAIFGVSAGLALLGVAVAYADRRVHATEPMARRASRAIVTGAGALTLAALLAIVIATGNPVSSASDKWTEFKQGGPTTYRPKGSRFTSDAQTNRYDVWRVAWANFEGAPLIGVGTDNFQQTYLRRGKTSESPRYPHSLELRVLSETGIIGALLLGGAIVAAFVALRPALRRRRGLAGAAAGAAAVSFSYWVLHGSVDWLWEFAGLGSAAFGLLGIAVATAATGAESVERAPERSVLRLAAYAAGAVAAAACAFALMLPWLSERETQRAAESWRGSPGAAFDRLDRAADLNPLSPKPALAAGTIAITIDDIDIAAREFDKALARDPADSYALLMRGALASELGQRAQAQEFMQRARRAAPNSEVIADAARSIAKGRRVDAIRIAGRLSAARRARVAPVLTD